MTTVRPSGLAGLFPAISGSYMEADSGYTGIELTNYRTVSLWVKIPTASGIPPGSTNAAMVFWGHDEPSGSTHGRVWSCELRNGKPRLWIRGAHMTVDRQIHGEKAIVDDGEWHLLVFQFQQGINIEDVEIYIDDMGPMDTSVFGAGTLINTTAAVNSQPFTLGARNMNTIFFSVEQDMILEQVGIWTEPLTSSNVAFLWNRGHNDTGLPVTGTDGSPEQSYDPSGLSGTIALDAWYTFDSPRNFTTQVSGSTDNPNRSLGVFNDAVPIFDTPASGIFPQ